MKKWIITFFLFCVFQKSHAAAPQKIYLIPGLGSDYRIFSKINFEGFDTVIVQRPMPLRHETLQQYALRLSAQIDTTQAFVILGVSFGGMLATEMAERLQPSATIIISSAKNRFELPFQYRFQRGFPVYKIIPKGFIKFSSFVLQPIVEPDSKREKQLFRAMLKAKDPAFLKRSSAMIVQWSRETNTANIVHIHGDVDKTIPRRNTKPTFVVKNGSHMMTLTEANKIGDLIHQVLIQ